MVSGRRVEENRELMRDNVGQRTSLDTVGNASGYDENCPEDSEGLAWLGTLLGTYNCSSFVVATTFSL